MKVKNYDHARDFVIPDIYGNKVTLTKFIGRKIHLTFYRFSGCPNCNLRFHKIENLSPLYNRHNVVSIAIFESSIENMKSQMAADIFYSIMIPDAEGRLYKLYDLDRSKLGLIYYLLFKGGIAELIEGKKLFKQKVEADGHADRLEAEFLINPDGKIFLAHYCKWQGDFLPLEIICDFIENKH